ncbi:MAG: MerR family transcriptional regulator [Chloroflexi bacterium]|nr:MAG: MerR family transcriptional regulator [Chloroflexota bacterium]
MATAAPTTYRIGELAAKVGLTERTLRYYEERGLLDSVKRLDGGQRMYTDDDVRRLKFIQKLKVLGLSLAEMQELETLYSLSERLSELAALRDEIRAYRHHVTKRLEEAK